jgi:hypothetical protein
MFVDRTGAAADSVADLAKLMEEEVGTAASAEQIRSIAQAITALLGPCEEPGAEEDSASAA